MTYESNPGHNTPSLTVFKGPYINLSFQDGPIRENGVNGTTNEEIIDLLIDRIKSLDEIMHSEYNDRAMDYLKSALGALGFRTLERQERGVEGTMQP